MSADGVPTLTATASVHRAQDVKLAPATRTTGDTLHIRAETKNHTEAIPDLVAISKTVSFADQDGTSNKSLSDIKTYECDGRLRRPKSWARKASKKKSTTASGAGMRGIVDTGATLHLMKDGNRMIDRKYRIVRERVKKKEILPVWIDGKTNPADVGTKAQANAPMTENMISYLTGNQELPLPDGAPLSFSRS